MTKHSDLIARIEAADGPSRELDDEIANALNLIPATHERAMNHGRPQAYYWHKRDHKGDYWFPPAYTSSLDAALSLVPEGAFWRLGHDGEGPDPSAFRADILHTPGAGHHVARATTLALALCAAALSALRAQEASE